MPQTLDDLTNEEFDRLIDRSIEQFAQWDGTLPLDTMLETWAEIERRKQPLVVRVRLVGDRISLEAPPESPLTVRGPRTLVLEDGRELTLEFEELLLQAA
jgi:hypothetical protein